MRSQKIRTAGLLLGVGLGGLLDAIVLNELLQWQGVPSAAWLRVAIWAVTLAGVIVLWSALRGPGPLPRGRVLAGWGMVGWGAFKLVEAVLAYDWVIFVAGGLGFIALGLFVKAVPAEAIIERRSGYDRRSASPLR